MRTPSRLALALLAGCGAPTSPVLQAGPAANVQPPVATPANAIALSYAHPTGQITLPKSSRPQNDMAPTTFGLIGPLAYRGEHRGAAVYATPLPIHSNLMPTKLEGTHSFGSSPPPGLWVKAGSTRLGFARGAEAPYSYGFSRDELFIGLPPSTPAPDWHTVQLGFEHATKYENGLNHGTSELSDVDFVQRDITLDSDSFNGLYLPAPASMSWSITVPDGGVLSTTGTVLSPAIKTLDRSDGAVVVFTLSDGGGEVASQRVDLAIERWAPVRWDVSAFSGKELTLTVSTEPGATKVFDYVFLEDPTIYTPSATPKRTVLLFIDTLRPDHLGLYGYDRATSPSIDEWAKNAAVFTNARTVAPWTLPSARSALSGYQPEDWYDTQNIAEVFGAAGYHTEAVVSNAFLSQPFDMQRGFARYQYEHLRPADQVSAAAVQVFEQNPDRDVLLLVHYMDLHLPYSEGWRYRYKWASVFEPMKMSRAALTEIDPSGSSFDTIRDHVVARYDQNIRFVNDQVISVLDAAGPEATVILFSDHGEELWDHGGFEHGHSFYDELLKVTMVVKGPHVPPGRYDQPVSLLDLAPTAAELAGLPAAAAAIEAPGQSLVDLLFGVPGAAESLVQRPQAFGRPLYYGDGWSVLANGHKWIDRDGVQRVYDLGADASEQRDVAAANDVSDYPNLLQSALSRDVLPVWRIKPKTKLATSGTTIRVQRPGGFSDAWAAYDPRGRAAATTVKIQPDGSLRVYQPRGADMPTSIFVVPKVDPSKPDGLHIQVSGPGQKALDGRVPITVTADGPARHVIIELGNKGWSVIVDTAHVPVPHGVAVSAYHQQVEEQLRELGYTDDGE